MQATVILHPGRDAALRRHHPWIFSGAVAEIKGSPASGDVVTVRSAQGEFLCYGDYSPTSQIRVRALSFTAASHLPPIIAGSSTFSIAVNSGSR